MIGTPIAKQEEGEHELEWEDSRRRLTPEGREGMFADFALRASAKRVGVMAEEANTVLFALTTDD